MTAHTTHLKHHARQHALSQHRFRKHNAVGRHPQVAAVGGQKTRGRSAQMRDAEFAFAAAIGVGVANGGSGRKAAQACAVAKS
jgi:hypothetical protein